MAPRDEAARVRLLLRLAQRVTARHDMDDVLAEVFRCLRPLVRFSGGSIQLMDEDGWIQMAASEPVAPPHVMAQRIPLGASVAGRVILTEQPTYLPDIQLQTSGRGGQVAEGARSYLGVPLVADGRAIGVLQIDAPDVDAWTEEERGTVVAVGPVVAAAIQNARAHARADLARLRANAAEARLADARRLAALARATASGGDRHELDQVLNRLEALLSAGPEKTIVPLPTSRVGSLARTTTG